MTYILVAVGYVIGAIAGVLLAGKLATGSLAIFLKQEKPKKEENKRNYTAAKDLRPGQTFRLVGDPDKIEAVLVDYIYAKELCLVRSLDGNLTAYIDPYTPVVEVKPSIPDTVQELLIEFDK